MEKEIWKDIKGYEGKYKVSNMGRVKSLNYNKTGKEGILKPKKDRYGYLQVHLSKDRKAKMYLVHRLVASAFLENPMGYTEVNHKDENKQNNYIENLEWCDRSHNINHGTRNQKISKPVIAIDKRTGLILEFVSVHEAERETGIASSNITNCCKGKLNSCGGFYWMYANNNDAE